MQRWLRPATIGRLRRSAAGSLRSLWAPPQERRVKACNLKARTEAVRRAVGSAQPRPSRKRRLDGPHASRCSAGWIPVTAAAEGATTLEQEILARPAEEREAVRAFFS